MSITWDDIAKLRGRSSPSSRLDHVKFGNGNVDRTVHNSQLLAIRGLNRLQVHPLQRQQHNASPSHDLDERPAIMSFIARTIIGRSRPAFSRCVICSNTSAGPSARSYSAKMPESDVAPVRKVKHCEWKHRTSSPVVPDRADKLRGTSSRIDHALRDGDERPLHPERQARPHRHARRRVPIVAMDVDGRGIGRSAAREKGGRVGCRRWAGRRGCERQGRGQGRWVR